MVVSTPDNSNTTPQNSAPVLAAAGSGGSIEVVAVNDAPLLGSLAAIELVDSSDFDAFSAGGGSLAGNDPEGASLSYGLEGAVAAAASFDGISYDLSKAGAYGTLYLNSSTGQYRFQPAGDFALNAISASGSESFVFTSSDGSLTSSTPLLLTFSAADDTPVQYVVVNEGLPVLSATAASLWDQALTQASAYLAELLTRADRDTLLNDVFGRAGTEATALEANKQALLEAIGTTGLRIAIDLRSGTEMEGAIGAYAQVGPNGNEQIHINADWINAGNLSLEQLTAVVLEEYGHALDVRLNPGLESAGDEGELFANLITNAGLNADQIAAINTQNDWGTVQVDGQMVVVEEQASAAPTSTTLGAVGTTQTINRATAQAINLGLTFNASNNQGSDILVAAFNGTTLIGWTIYDRSSDLDAGSGGATRSITVSFNLAQFNTNVSAGSLSFRYWQGSAAGTAGNDNLSVTQLGSSTAPFRVDSSSTAAISTNITLATTLAGGQSATWTNTTVDVIAPTLAITTPISTDNFVNNAEDESSLIISGTSAGADGRTVTVSVGSITAKTATIAAGGAWSISLTSAEVKTLAEGTVNISANVSDTAGNPATQASASFLYDITAPTLTAAVTALTDNSGSVTGVIASGGLTDDTIGLVVSGTLGGATAGASLAAGETLRIFDGATYLGDATVTVNTGAQSTWTYTDNRTYTNAQALSYTAQVGDAAGNQSAAGTAYTATSYLGLLRSDAAPAGTLNASDISSGYTISIGSFNNSSWGDDALIAAKDGNGNLLYWQTVQAAADTSVTIAAASLGSYQGSLSFSIYQGSAYATGSVNSGIYSGAFESYPGTTNNFFINFNYVFSYHSTTTNIYILDASTNFRSDNTGVSGSTLFDSLAASGIAASPFTTYTLDSVAPAAPTFALATDSGSSNSDGVTNVGTVNVFGVETNATWAYTTNGNAGTPLWTTGSGSSFTLAAGTYAIGAVRVRQTDLAGNVTVTPSQNAAAITVDAIAPGTPFISSVTDDVTPITGPLTSGGRTNDTNLTVRVSTSASLAVAGDTIQLYDSLATLGSAYTLQAADITNQFADVAIGPLTNGTTYKINAKVIDLAGNASGTPSLDFSVTVDTTAPNVGTASFTSVTEGSLDTTPNAVTNQATASVVFTYTGSDLLAGESFQYSTNNSTWTTIAAGSVNTTANTVTISSLNVSGSPTVYLRALDAAGNTTTLTSQAITYDGTAPNAPVISTVTDDVSPVTGTVASGGITNDTVLVLAGTAEANSTVTLYNSSTSLGTTSANGSGAWSFTTATLTNGSTYTFNATATDAAGNVSAASANYTVTVDTAAPTATVAITAVVSDTGSSSSDYITSDTTLVVNGSTWADVSVATATTWTYTDPNTRTSNLIYQVRVIDTAGNVGNTASRFVTIDTAAPTSSVGSQSVQLVEAGGITNGTTGTAAATITVTKSDALTTASFDTAYLTSNGWSTANAGVTYTKTGTYGTATFTIASGVVAYALSNSTAATQALTANQAASDGFGTVQIVDTAGNTSLSSAIAFAITGTNDAPIVTSGATASIDENGTGTVYTATGSDPEGTAPTYTLGGVDSSLFNINSTTGAITFKNSPNFEAPADAGANNVYAITVSAFDGSLSSAPKAVAISVTNINEAPIAVADTATATAIEAGGINNGTAGTEPTGNVLTNDTDVDFGDSKTLQSFRTGATLGSGTAGTLGTAITGTFGSLTLAADGSYIYTVDNANSAVQSLPSSSDTLSDSFNYTVVDAAGASSTTSLTLTIQGANDAPTLKPVSAGWLTDTADNDSFSEITGTLVGDDVDANTTFTYGLSGGSAYPTPIPTHSVEEINKAIEAYEKALLSYTQETRPQEWAAINNNLGNAYSALAHFSAKPKEQITIAIAAYENALKVYTDKELPQAWATTNNNLGLAYRNIAPFSSKPSEQINEQINNAIAAHENALRVYAELKLAQAWATTKNNLEAAHRDLELFASTDPSEQINKAIAAYLNALRVKDPVQLSNSLVQIEGNFGDLGIANKPTEGATPGPDKVSLAGIYGFLTLNTSSGDYTYTPNAAAINALTANAADTFTFSVSDGTASATTGFTINITGSNDRPIGSNASVNVHVGQPYSFVEANFPFSDADAGSAWTAVKIVSLPAVGSLELWNGTTWTAASLNAEISASDAMNGKLRFVPPAGATTPSTGYTSFTVQVKDNSGTSDGSAYGATTTISVNLLDARGPANTVPIEQRMNEDTILSFSSGLSIAFPAATGSDGLAATVANDITTSVAIASGYQGSLSLNASLAGGAAVSGSSSNLSLRGTVAQINASLATLVYTPAANANGDQAVAGSSTYDRIEISTVNNPATINGILQFQFPVDVDTLDINVTPVNDPIVAVADTATALEASGIANAIAGSNPSGNVLNNDTDLDAADLVTVKDTKTVTAVRTGATPGSGTAGSLGSALAGAYGALTLNADGSYSYAVNNGNAAVNALAPGGSLTDSFNYTARDTAGSDSSTTLTITITGADDGPSITSAAAVTFAENGSGTAYTVIGSDPEVSSLTYAISGGADANLFTINNLTGAVAFKTAPDFENPTDNGNNNVYDLTVTANDGILTSSSQAVTISVTNVNDNAPVLLRNMIALLEGATDTLIFATSTSSANEIIASDADGLDSLIFAVSTNQASGSSAFDPAIAQGYFQLSTNPGASNAISSFTYSQLSSGQVRFVHNGTEHTPFYYLCASDGISTTAKLPVQALMTNVNDAPSATSSILTINEDTARTLLAADFGFTDPQEGYSLSAVLINSLPSAGNLTLNGVAVNAGAVIAASSLVAGSAGLVFTPAANANGNAHSGFAFQLRDNGGISNGGVDTSAAASLSFNVTPLNDAPVVSAGNSVGYTETGSPALINASITVSDVDSGSLSGATDVQQPLETIHHNL